MYQVINIKHIIPYRTFLQPLIKHLAEKSANMEQLT
jgi:hypothetical protein